MKRQTGNMVFFLAFCLMILVGCNPAQLGPATLPPTSELPKASKPQPIIQAENRSEYTAPQDFRGKNPFGRTQENVRLPNLREEDLTSTSEESFEEEASAQESLSLADRLARLLSSGTKPLTSLTIFDDKTRVALLAPLSGRHEKIGKSLLNAAHLGVVDMAHEDFVLMTYDTQGTPQGAEEAAREAISSGARMIIGPLLSQNAQSIASIARREDVPVLSFTNDRSRARDNIFVLGHSPEPEIARALSFAVSQGKTRVAALLPDSELGVRMRSLIQSLAGYYNFEFVQHAFYPVGGGYEEAVKTIAHYEDRRQNMVQYRSTLEKTLEGLDPSDPLYVSTSEELQKAKETETYGDLPYDILVVPEATDAVLQIVPLLPFYDIAADQVQLVGLSAWEGHQVWRDRAFRGAWIAGSAPEQRRDFETRYRQSFGETPPRLASLSYDAMALAITLSKREGDSFSEAALTQPNGFSGIDGILRLRPDYLVERGLSVMEVRTKGLRVIDAAPKQFNLE